MLIEVGDEELRLVATDRYRLAVRVLRTRRVDGGPSRVLVDAAELADMATWALRQQYVDVEVYGDGGCLVGEGGERRAFVGRTAEDPDYRLVLDGPDDVRHRVIVDRAVLRAAFAEREKGAVLTTRPGAQEAAISGSGGSPVTVSAVCTGPSLRVAFDPAVLVPALDAGVGPDVLLEIASGTDPVVVRSADQGSFTTLVMPVRECVSRETG